ncbi:FtsX-like permease family protein [Carboxylicivirga mesophila]|uniref:FtsX-like permease family protein n=1 Tax=Carboxylicivirga mesophila TaxID=1166478 RepID=A0ABS5KB46_9BACT|nr:FtsX-like permease family protein [Carboxylicivirga mesophila]MBS2211733.1 FtsX-like permease family protein [Carboxylicivirga mesophila]
MIQFLIKGILRDKSRSLLPVIVVSLGVFLTVFMSGWMKGVFGDMIDMNANYTMGHVKVMSRAYADNEAQIPNDLALLDVSELISRLEADYPDMEWVRRIQFGGLLDVPDANGETRAQGPAAGRAVDLLTPGSKEAERLNIPKSIVKGRLPEQQGEVLISNEFAERFAVNIGDDISVMGSTMYGSMVVPTFKVCGTINFGMAMLDRGAIIMDITDAEQAFDMIDAAGEVLGYCKSNIYDDELALAVRNSFNLKYNDESDEFAPLMVRLRDEPSLKQYLNMADNMSAMMVMIFVIAMSIVLWNTGLLGGLRRYTEYGVRLALGEEKGHIFRTIIYEAIIIGSIGSVVGSALGIATSYYLQENGIDFSSMMENVTMMMPMVYRAKVSPELFYIGFIPGLLAMTLGNALAGYAIYKRKTAQLFKELEV